MIKYFFKKLGTNLLIMAVLLTLYNVLLYRGICIFSGGIPCGRAQFFVETGIAGIIYVTPLMFLLSLTQTINHRRLQKLTENQNNYQNAQEKKPGDQKTF